MSGDTKPEPEACMVAVAGILTAPIAYAVEGWVLWLAWRWWLIDLGAPNLPYGTAVAITFLVGLLTANVGVDRDPQRTLIDQWTLLVVAPLILWILGLVAT